MPSKGVLIFHRDGDTRRWIGDTLHSGHGTFGVLGDTDNMQEALVLARFHQPHLILIGVRESPDLHEFFYGLRAAAPQARIVGYLDEDQDVPALVPAYDAFVTHKRKPQKLLEALERATHAGS